MLKIVHVLTGIVALVLSFVPSLAGGIPLLLQPEAICLLLLGLLNVQFIPSAQLHARGPKRPVMLAVSAMLVLAVVIQICVLLIPVAAIAGQPATLASLLLAFIAVLLHLAAAQRRDERPSRTHSTPRTRAASSAATAAGRETGTVKWFNTSKGFGFISRDSGDDVFVHFRAIRGEGHRVLVEGQRVEYTIMMRDKGLQAEDVITTQ